VDGEEEKEHGQLLSDSPDIAPIIFSFDSRQLAYVVEKDYKQFVVVNGKEEKRYDGITALPIFSPDCNRMAYVAEIENKQFIVCNGSEEKQYDGIVSGGPIFSPDSRRLAYTAIVGNNRLVIIDGKEGKQYSDATGNPVFSPNTCM